MHRTGQLGRERHVVQKPLGLFQGVDSRDDRGCDHDAAVDQQTDIHAFFKAVPQLVFDDGNALGGKRDLVRVDQAQGTRLRQSGPGANPFPG